jgi:hypothetical protein
MANRKIFYGMLALALVFGMVLIACPNDTTDETWSPVNSLEQLKGTWKGSHSETMGFADFLSSDIGPDMDPNMGEMFKDLKVKIESEMTMTVDTARQTGAMIIKMTLTFSGKNIDTLWKDFSSGIPFFMPEAEVNNDKHSMTFTAQEGSGPLGTVTAGMLQFFEINQTGRKIRILEDPDGNSDMPEMILTKQ